MEKKTYTIEITQKVTIKVTEATYSKPEVEKPKPPENQSNVIIIVSK